MRGRAFGLLLAVTLLSSCTAAGTEVPPPSASPSASAESAYLRPLTGFRYAPLDVKSGVDFRTPLQQNAATRSAIRGYTLRAITFNGESYGVTLELFDIDPLVAGRDGMQDTLVTAATGRVSLREVGLGGRPVAYFNVSNFTSYLWLQGTTFAIVSAEPISVGKAALITESLINANTTESRYVVSGQVLSKANGNPVPNVTVWVTLAGRDCCTNVVPGVVSGPTGRYQFYVPEGDYRILLYPRGIDGFGAGWYRDASDFDSAETIHVTRNTSVGDSSLPAGHAVSGHLTWDGAPAKGGHVDVFSNAGGFVMGFDVNDDGTWLFRLAAGRYRLLFWPPDGSTAHEKWWRSGDDVTHSEVLIVGDSDVPNIDASFERGSL